MKTRGVNHRGTEAQRKTEDNAEEIRSRIKIRSRTVLILLLILILISSVFLSVPLCLCG